MQSSSRATDSVNPARETCGRAEPVLKSACGVLGMPFLRTSLLRAEPAGVLQSLDELFALAHAMEQEAANKYDSLADEMRGQGKNELAEVFTRLAAAERDHVDSVTSWSQSRRGKSPDPALVRWEAPEPLPPDAAAEVRNSRLMTPYRALAMAVRNEERAFAFWSYLAAYSDDADIKKASEMMAREELGHVATLRKERRRAYHHEHDRSNVGASSGPPRQIDARRLELRLAAQLDDLEPRLSEPAAVRIRDIRQQTIEMAAAASGLGSFAASVEHKGPLEVAEALVDGYLEGAERSTDAAHLERLQHLAEQAIARLAWLRSLSAA
ncbi:ferritin family protein [Bradyrhizobium sp. NBAIM20]|uniref:ferritin family protein n=2 Tax=unclassified Bradyrhizobium TaxID=2631580 RepID=UPI00320AE556